MKRFLKGLMVLVLLVTTFVPYIHVSAAGDKVYHYTWIVNKTENETVPADTDLLEYVNSKKTNVQDGADYNDEWLNLYGEFDGVYKYPKKEDGLTFVFNGEETIDGVRHLYYDIKYTEVIVTKEASTESRVQILMSESIGNNHGTFNVTGGAFGITINQSSSINRMVDNGTQITLTTTPSDGFGFVGWFNAVEGTNGYEPTEVLSGSTTYVFNATAPYYNIMPVFEAQVSCSNGAGHNNIWTTSNGKVAVIYEAGGKNGTFGNGEVVDYCIGDEITVKAQANEGYHFVGWYVSNVEQGPEYYESSKLVSTNANYTYKPGVTTVSGIDEPINYITAVFEVDSSANEITNVNLTVTLPSVGDTVSYNSNTYFQGPQATITIPSNSHFVLDGNTSNVNYMNYYTHGTDTMFNGTFQSGTTYDMHIWLVSTDNYLFSEDNLTITVNGNSATLIQNENGEAIGIKYSFEPTATTTTYTIQEGNDQTYTKGSNKDIVIKASGDLSKLVSIEIDNGNVVDPSNYELANGSTILTLKSAFLENSSVGEHTITFRYNDGEAEAKLTIANATNPTPTNNDVEPIPNTGTDNPQTGDNIGFYVTMLILSTIGLGGTILITRKRFN